MKCKFRHCKRSLVSANYFIYPRLFHFSIIFETNLDYSFVDHPIEDEIEDEIDLSVPHLPKYGKTRWCMKPWLNSQRDLRQVVRDCDQGDQAENQIGDQVAMHKI